MKYVLCFLVSVCMADQYLHYPRGSNNRLNEASANRNNGNRLFDSQNNNRGGYNVGEFDDTQGFDTGRDTIHTKAQFDAREDLQFNYLDYSWNDEQDDNDANGQRQNEDVYMDSSELLVTWTSQHGCGNEKNNCNMVLEYTCDTHPVYENILEGDGANIAASEKTRQSAATRGTDANGNIDDSQIEYDLWDGTRVQLINGLNTNTPDDPNNLASIAGTFANNNDNKRGRHESEEYYEYGQKRHRNKGLFTADQNLQGNAQKYTRQNPGGTRRGLELPEERDYFPWTSPTIWRPVAILTNDIEECEEKMQAHTQQAEPKCACAPNAADITGNNDDKVRADENDCPSGQWKCHQFTTMDPPPCVQNKWSQVNNLGNVDGTEDGGLPQTYAWTLPSVQDMADTGCWKYRRTMTEGTGNTFDYIRWVFRVRYNMTTGDYSPYETDARCNDNRNNYQMSPIEQNPTVDIGVEAQGLRLAINTAQLGRTFQDRTHVLTLMERPAALNNKKIYNLNVQGKRGNIVQTFPAVEYDFWPKKLEIKTGECMAMSWTGSNTHNNGNPAGDGQAGDAGEGRGGSDRHNFLQYTEKKNSFPYPLDKFEAGGPQQMLKTADVYKTHTGEVVNSGADGNWENYDAQAYLLSSGFYQTMTGNNGVGDFGNAELQELLNNAPATMRSITVCPKEAGEYIFGCTRNNNFSNRDQKFVLKVTN